MGFLAITRKKDSNEWVQYTTTGPVTFRAKIASTKSGNGLMIITEADIKDVKITRIEDEDEEIKSGNR